ncbi:YfhJ family protein [Alkalicoccus chagannorensis]|uniref:YfhJ family protein n=1 Tax=Alkalicoccus chagannorensis TaxID=427072 RepID=UPI0003F6FBB6|nr:YfhJ family protein [Alkalicoccus chagannorensis]
MEETKDRLTRRLMEKNKDLTFQDAQTWVELLWEDFEATYAKAGRSYKGEDMAEKIVTQWVDNYGDRLHELAARYPKYQKWFQQRRHHK